MAEPRVSEKGGIGDIGQLLASLGPLFGTGKTTTKNTIGNEGDVQTLIQSIMASVSPENLDLLQQGVLDKAKETFAPANIAGNAAGLRAYSDTTRADLATKASSRAAAEAMAARLNAMSQAQAAASRLTEAKMNNTRSTESKTGSSPTGEFLKYATPLALLANKFGGAGGKYFTDNFPNITNIFKTGEDTSGDVIPGSGDSQVANSSTDALTNDILIANQSMGGDTVTPNVQSLGDEESIVQNFPEEGGPSLDGGDAGGIDVGGGEDDILDEAIFGDGSGIDFFDGGIVKKNYADGGVTPGSRPKPGSYTDEAVQYAAAKKAPPKATTLFNANPISSRGKRDTVTLENELSNDSSQPSATLESETGATGAFAGSVGKGGLAMAGLHGLAFGPLGAVMSLAKSAMLNDLIGQATQASAKDSIDLMDNDMLSAMISSMMFEGQNTPASLTPGAVDESGATTAGMSNTAPDTSFDLEGAAFGLEGGTSPAAGDPSNSGIDFGGTAGAPGGTEGGSEGGGEGGGDGEVDGGVQDADSAKEASGIDKKVIHVTPGESVLPVDTTKALQQMFGDDVIEQIIAATHTPMRKQLRKAA